MIQLLFKTIIHIHFSFPSRSRTNTRSPGPPPKGLHYIPAVATPPGSTNPGTPQGHPVHGSISTPVHMGPSQFTASKRVYYILLVWALLCQFMKGPIPLYSAAGLSKHFLKTCSPEYAGPKASVYKISPFLLVSCRSV